ncbi:MAG: DUF4340 domain-containing protein, partial [Gemmataceae bacterium]
EIRFWYDGTEFAPLAKDAKPGDLPAEPKLKNATPNTTILIGRVEGDDLIARRSIDTATSMDVKLPASLLPTLTKDRRGYMNYAMKSFATNLATKLEFNRGAENFSIVKGEKPSELFPNGQWTFESPPSLKGTFADPVRVGGGSATTGAGLIGLLATITAVDLASEAPTDSELKTFGLDASTPHMTAKVTLSDEKDKSRVYEFGNSTPEGCVYARTPDKKFVYRVLKTNLDRLLTDDLRDPTFYRLDRDQVTEIRMTGWKGKNATATEYIFERKGPASWAAKKSPAPFLVNGSKMEMILTNLIAPKPAYKVGTQQKTEHGFDLKSAPNPLEIAIFRRSEPPIVLNLGSETDAGQGYFVWCSTAPGDVSVIPALPFQPLKASVDFLKP